MSTIVVGVISDTHGLLRPQALAALQGVDLILHAGDVGDPAVLERLAQVAPVQAVRGNIDRAAWAGHLPERLRLELGGAVVVVIHQLEHLPPEPPPAGVQAVIYGHTHKPELTWRGGVLWLNPGSAGPRRFKLPVGLARLEIAAGSVSAQLVPLEAAA